MLAVHLVLVIFLHDKYIYWSFNKLVTSVINSTVTILNYLWCSRSTELKIKGLWLRSLPFTRCV